MKSFVVMLAILFISLVLVSAEDKIVRRSLQLTKSPKTNFPKVTKAPKSKTKSPKTTKSPTPTKAPVDKSTKAPKKEKTASPKVTKAPKIITTKNPKVTKAPKIITTKNPKVTKAPKITTTTNPKATKVPKFDAKLPEIIPVPEKDNESPKTALDVTMLPTDPPNSVPSTTSITEVNTSLGEIVLTSFSTAVTTVAAIFSWLL